MAVEINAGASDSTPESFAVMGSNLYVAATGSSGRELYKVSGSTPTLVADLNTTGGSEPEELTAIGSTLWFTAQKENSTGFEVFRTDGTNILNSGNPWDINPGTGSSSAGGFTQVGSDVYFTADNGTNGFELLKSTGGTGTPALFKNINTIATAPGAPTDLGSFPYQVQPLTGSQFVFFASTNAAGNQLYNSDGTSSGTTIAKTLDASPRVEPSVPLAVRFDGANDKVLSVQYTPNEGQELYVNGVLLKDINPGPGSSQISGLVSLLSFIEPFPYKSTKAYFSAFDGTSTNLWRTDGTAAGTVKVTAETGAPENLTIGGIAQAPTYTGEHLAGRIAALITPSSPLGLHYDLSYLKDNGLFYTVPVVNGSNTEIHLKLLNSNGTTDTVTDLKTLNTLGNAVSEMKGTVNGLFFSNDDGVTGQEPWISDGSTAGTKLLKDINPGAEGSFPYAFSESIGDSFSNLGNTYTNETGLDNITTLPTVKFLADDGTSKGIGLFETDGESDGATPRYTNVSPNAIYNRLPGTRRLPGFDYAGTSSSGNAAEFSISSFGENWFISAYQSDTIGYEPMQLLLKVRTTGGGPFTVTNQIPDLPDRLRRVITESYNLNTASGQGSGASSFFGIDREFVNGNFGKIVSLFTADTGNGRELFRAESDVFPVGNLNGGNTCANEDCRLGRTSLSQLVDLFPGNDANGNPNASNPRFMTKDYDVIQPYANRAYFLADTATGTKVYQTNGTAATTVVTTELPTGDTPVNLALVDHKLVITARHPVANQPDEFKTYEYVLPYNPYAYYN
ncbi:MAG: hypothetical protein RBJ76_13695 [Stenomitos frigidus ULC029]